MNVPGGVPSMDGAFERFITAAIATIITIMFSWRLLTDVNEHDSTIPIISAPPRRLKHLTKDGHETDDSNDYENFSDADDEADIEPATYDLSTLVGPFPNLHSSHTVPAESAPPNISEYEVNSIRSKTGGATPFIESCYQSSTVSRKTDIPGGCVQLKRITYQHDEPFGLQANTNTAVAAAAVVVTSTTTTVTATTTTTTASKDIRVSSRVNHPSETGNTTVKTLGSAWPLQQVVSPPLAESVNTTTASLHCVQRTHSNDLPMTTKPNFSSESSLEAPSSLPPTCLSSTSTTVSYSSLPPTTTATPGRIGRPPPPPLPPRRPLGVTTTNNSVSRTNNVTHTTATSSTTNTNTTTGEQTRKPVIGRRAMANNNNKNNFANKNENNQPTGSSSSSCGSSVGSSVSSSDGSSLICNREFRNIVDDDDFKQMAPSRDQNSFQGRHRYLQPPPPPSPSHCIQYFDSDSDSDSEVFFFNGLEPIEEEDSDDLSSDSDRCEEYEVRGSYSSSVIGHLHDDDDDDHNNNVHTYFTTTTTTTTTPTTTTSSYLQHSSHRLSGVAARGTGSLLFPSHLSNTATITTTTTTVAAPYKYHHPTTTTTTTTSNNVVPRQLGRSFRRQNKPSEEAEDNNEDASSVDTSVTSPYVSSSDDVEEERARHQDDDDEEEDEEEEEEVFKKEDCADDDDDVTCTHATAVTVEQAPIIRPPQHLLHDNFQPLSNTPPVSTPPTSSPLTIVDNKISLHNIPIQHVTGDDNNNNSDTTSNYSPNTYSEQLRQQQQQQNHWSPYSDHLYQPSIVNNPGQIIDSSNKQVVRSTEELSNPYKKPVTARPLSQTIGDLSDTSRDLTTYNENALLSFSTSTNERSQRIKDDFVSPTHTPIKSRERSYSDGDVNQEEEGSNSPTESSHGLMMDIRANSTPSEETEFTGDEFIIVGKNVPRVPYSPTPDVHYTNQSNWPIQLYFDAMKSNAAENPPRGFIFSHSEPSETAHTARTYYWENDDNNSNMLNNNVQYYNDHDVDGSSYPTTRDNDRSVDNLNLPSPKDYIDNSPRRASDDIDIFTTSQVDNGPVIFKRAISMTEPACRQVEHHPDQHHHQSHHKHGHSNPMSPSYTEQEAMEKLLHYDGLPERDIYINKYSNTVCDDYVTLDTLDKSYPDVFKKGGSIENTQDINSNQYVLEENAKSELFPDVVKKDTYNVVNSSQQDTTAAVHTFPDVVNKGTAEKTQAVMAEGFTVLECQEKRQFPDIVHGKAYHVANFSGYDATPRVIQETVEKSGFPDIVNREEFHAERQLKDNRLDYSNEKELIDQHEEDTDKIPLPEHSDSVQTVKTSHHSVTNTEKSKSTELSNLEFGVALKPPPFIKINKEKCNDLVSDTYTTSVDPVRTPSTTQIRVPSIEIGSSPTSHSDSTANEDLVTSIDSEVDFEVFKSDLLAHSEDYNSLYSLDKLNVSEGNLRSSQADMSSNRSGSDNYEGSISLEEYDELTDLVNDQVSPPRTSALHRPLTVNTGGSGSRQIPLVRRKINAVRKRYFGSDSNVSDLVDDENSVSNKFARYRKTSLRALKRRDAAKHMHLQSDQEVIRASKIRPSKSLSHISHRSDPKSRKPRPSFHETHPGCILSPGNADNLEESIQAASIDNLESCLSQYDSFCSLVETDIDTGETTERRFSIDSEVFEIPFSFQQSYSGKSTSLMDLRAEQQVRRSAGKGRFADRNVPKSKSMQTLETNLDDDEEEDDLLGESSFRRVPSIHELRVTRSLQKLNVPAWYKNSSVSRSGSCILNRDSDSMKSYDWRFNASVTSSPASSIINHQAPVVIKTRVTPGYKRSYSAPIKSPKLVLPPKPANVKLPSDQFRTQEKPKGLMPIPIVPFLKIREMFEKKSQENNDKPTFPTPISPVTISPVKNTKPEPPPKRITPVKRESDSAPPSKKSPVSPGFSPALRIDEVIEETNEEEEEEEEEIADDFVDALSYSTQILHSKPLRRDSAEISGRTGTVTFSTAPPMINGNSPHVQDGIHKYNNTTAESHYEQQSTVDDIAPIIRRPVARRPPEAETNQQAESPAKPAPSVSTKTRDAEAETRVQDSPEKKEQTRKVVKVSERIQMYDQASSSKEAEKTKTSKDKDWKPKLFSFRDSKVAKSQPKQTPPQPPPPKAKLPVPFFRNRKETTV
ncbi:uncharacterized protein LOC115222763 isoform X1 [Argonauta hians]